MGDTIELDGKRADIIIARDSDVNLDVEWWEVDATTPIPIQSCQVLLMDSWLETRREILDLGPYIAINGNVIEIRIPAAVTSLIKQTRGVWLAMATDAVSGATQCIVRGQVAIRDERKRTW